MSSFSSATSSSHASASAFSGPLSSKNRFTAYRLLTGPDDASFCHRVTEALSRGWLLYGPPTLSFDATAGRMMCGQAVTKDVEGASYNADLKLGAL